MAVGTVDAKAQALEEVIVTAQKREQSLQDVPIAVAAFSNEMLQKAGVKDMFELQANDPSLVVGQGHNASTSSFGIRGVFTSSNNFGLESSVGLYVDGVYRARQGSMLNDLVDIGRIEILRGPQGTLFGRNTPAGAISVFSVEPDFEGTGYLQVEGGEYSLLSGQGAKSFTVIEDILATRVTGFYTERDGTISDVSLGDDKINDRDRWGVRLQALWTPTDELSVHVIADHSEIDEVCCTTNSWKNNFVADEVPGKTGTDANAVALGSNIIPGSEYFEREVALTFLPSSENEDKGISVQVDWQADWFTLTSITAYREFESHETVDVDFIDLDGNVQDNQQEQSQFSQELRFANQFDNWNYVAGLYYYEQSLDTVSYLGVGDDASALLGLPPNAFIGGTGSTNFADQEHTSYAVFGQSDINLTDSLVLTAGLRWTNEEKELSNIFIDDAGEGPLPIYDNWGFYFFPPLAPVDDVYEEIDDDQITGTLKLSWFAFDDIMFYASYGTGYKSGGTNTDRLVPGLPYIFGPEDSESYEVGMKATFPEQALRLNVAIHRTDTNDLQTVSFQGNGFTLLNAGVAEAQGAEVEVSWLPTERLTMNLGYAYNDGEYSDFELGPCQVATPWHTGLPDPGDNGDGTCDRSGGMLRGNAENRATLSADYRFSFSSVIEGFIYGEYIYTDERMTDVNNDPLKLDDDYFYVNLRAGLDWISLDTSLTVWARNLTDEDIVATIADAVAQEGKLIGYYGAPRTWGITLRKNW
jgi:outer membrane receptor protein involved in Fe transport